MRCCPDAVERKEIASLLSYDESGFGAAKLGEPLPLMTTPMPERIGELRIVGLFGADGMGVVVRLGLGDSRLASKS